MKRLGEILLERGALAVGELHTALDACHRTGARLGTQLLTLGYVDEHTLLEVLSEQYGVPPVTEVMLRRAPVAVREAVSPELLRRLHVVPFKSVAGRTHVAMLNPRDLAAIEEIVAAVSSPVDAYVATENAILGVLSAPEPLRAVTQGEAAAEPPEPEKATDGWDDLWEPPRAKPEAVLSWQPDRRERSEPLIATFPALAPVVAAEDSEWETLDDTTFCERLLEARHRDQVGECLLRFAGSYLSRVCLFAVHKGRIFGWMGSGPSVVIDDVQSFEALLETPSLFSTVHQSGQSFVGPIPLGGGVNESMSRVLGEPAPIEVVLVPVRVKERTVAFVLGDVPEDSVLAVPLPELYAAASKASIAFEILILRSKIAGS
jgi:hypothetical protein